MKKKEEENSSIFVPGLDKEVPVDQVVNINPEVDIRKAEYFILIHGTENIDYNEETKVFTRNLSTGHRSIEFIAKGKIDGHFGKYPVHGSPIDLAEIKDDSKRYENGKEYDKLYGTSTVHTKIIPVTPEQYKASFTHADKAQESPGIFNVIDNNCNDFANNVLKPTGIKISDIYTEKELKAQGKLVDVNILANWGACDKPYQVTESILVNVADKYKVPQDRILSHPVDFSNPDVRIYTIFPEGVCPTGIVVDDARNRKLVEHVSINVPKFKLFNNINNTPNDTPKVPGDIVNKSKYSFDKAKALYQEGKFSEALKYSDIALRDIGDINGLGVKTVEQANKLYLEKKQQHIDSAVKRDGFYNQGTINGVNAFSWVKDNPTRDFYTFFRETLKVSDKSPENVDLIQNRLYKNLPKYLEEANKSNYFLDEYNKYYDAMTKLQQVSDIYNIIAGANKGLKDYEEALKSCEIALEIDPTSATLVNLKNSILKEKQAVEAKKLGKEALLDLYIKDPTGYFEQLKIQCKDAIRECLSKAQKQLAKFVADKAGEEKKYTEDIKAKAQAEVEAAGEKCRSKCDDKYSEYDAKVKAETKIKVENAQAVHAGHVGGCGCPSVIDNKDIVAKYQPIYDNFCKQYKEEAEKEIAQIEKKYQAMINGKAESIKESIHVKQEAINEAIASLDDKVNKVLEDVATSINMGAKVSTDSISKQLEQSVNDFKQKADATINNVTVMLVSNIEYDNPVLNHPELIKGMAEKFGSGIINKIINFGMQFTNNQEDREVLEGICNGDDSVDAMSLLMGLDVNHDVTYH